jgi:REase_AHJR-like
MDRRVAQENFRRRIEPVPEGWDLIFEPSPASLPGPLASLRLDAVATDGKAGIVYEFAVGRRALQDNGKVEKLRELRRATHSIPGWSFELIIVPEPPPALLSLAAIDERVEAIRSILAPEGQNAENGVLLDGMFLMAFTVLESCIAALAFEHDIDYQPLAVSLGTALTEEGVVSQEQLDKVRRYQDKRNRIVHGVRETHVTRNEVIALLSLSAEIRALMDRQRTT